LKSRPRATAVATNPRTRPGTTVRLRGLGRTRGWGTQPRGGLIARLCMGHMKQGALRYEVIIYWSADDEAFNAEVPELAGCATDGPTPQEALAQAEIVAREWIETARELGRLIPEPKGRLAFA
jgi:predicted RNase H-like HicB family nuclease